MVIPRSTADPDEVARALAEVVELLDAVRDLSPAPLSGFQLRAVLVLERVEGANLRTLGEALGASPPSVSRLCDRLEAVGFVERSPHPASRREVELRLTEGGRGYLADLRARRLEGLRAVARLLPPDAHAGLLQALAQFRHAAVEAGAHLLPRPEPA